MLYNRRGKIIARGKLHDLNEKSAGFEIKANHLKVNEVYFIEFTGPRFFPSQVKVVLRRLAADGLRVRVGVEFLEATPMFLERICRFLGEKRRDQAGFDEPEIT